jgi:hypothetical protein
MFLYSLIVAVLSFSATAELNRIPEELVNLNTGAFLVLLGAVYIFVGSIGMAGWMRSRIAGILTTIFAVISLCMITYAVSSVISLLCNFISESARPAKPAGRSCFSGS